MKIAIPWILTLALLGGVYFLYADNQKKSAIITRLIQDGQNLETLRAENEELKKSATQSGDATQLQKEHEDLLRLRNEVQTLRRQTNELNGRLGAAQAQGAQAQQTQQQLSQIAAENQALRNQTQKLQQAQEQAVADPAKARDVCINNLRMIDAAKQQWALENKKAPNDVPVASDISPYLQNGKIPACPGGGAYTIGNLQTAPACSVNGHSLE